MPHFKILKSTCNTNIYSKYYVNQLDMADNLNIFLFSIVFVQDCLAFTWIDLTNNMLQQL